MQCREVNRYRTGCSRQEVQEVHRVPGGLHTDWDVVQFAFGHNAKLRVELSRFDVTSCGK
jgi:hypothetical protein